MGYSKEVFVQEFPKILKREIRSLPNYFLDLQVLRMRSKYDFSFQTLHLGEFPVVPYKWPLVCKEVQHMTSAS